MFKKYFAITIVLPIFGYYLASTFYKHTIHYDISRVMLNAIVIIISFYYILNYKKGEKPSFEEFEKQHKENK